MSYCSPNREDQKLTCFSKESLIKIAKAYNESHEDKIKIKDNKVKLWYSIREKMSNKCKEEVCWIDQNFVKSIKDKEINQYTFKPKKPESWKYNKYEWLSTTDINVVMKQYEKKYEDFFFIGPVPLDCYYGSSLRCELTNLKLKSFIKSGLNSLGIIYNLDYSYQDGSHWVAFFLSLNDNKMTYFDSVGSAPPMEIVTLMNSYKKQLNELGINIDIEINRKQHQKKNSECGIYSMNFIIQRLKGKTLKDINKKRIPDELMNEMRNILYRNSNK